MCEHNHESQCPECGGMDGMHYSGCTSEGTGQQEEYSSGSGNGISTFGAIQCVVGSFVGTAALFVLFDIDVESVPLIVIVILWIVVAAVIAGVVSAFKSR